MAITTEATGRLRGRPILASAVLILAPTSTCMGWSEGPHRAVHADASASVSATSRSLLAAAGLVERSLRKVVGQFGTDTALERDDDKHQVSATLIMSYIILLL